MRQRATLVALVGVAIGIGYVILVIAKAGWDPTVMLAEGSDESIQHAYAERALQREVFTRPDLGHDGHFFFIQANDPFLVSPAEHAAFLDQPLYRSQRMAYPMLASFFGLLGPMTTLWGMIIVNIGAVAWGTMVTSLIGQRLNASPWLGLAFVLNPGVIAELDISGSGVLALAAALAAVLAVIRGQFVLGTCLLTLSVLSRETLILVAIGLWLGMGLWKGRWQFQLVVYPAVLAVVWRLIALWRLLAERVDPSGDPSSRVDNLGVPLEGLIEAVSIWEGRKLIFMLALLILWLIALARAMLSRSILGWSVLPAGLLGLVLAVPVWREPYDFARAVAPIFTAYPILLAARNPKSKQVFN